MTVSKTVRQGSNPWSSAKLKSNNSVGTRCWGRGEIGRRTGFRFQRREVWEFESLRPHHVLKSKALTLLFYCLLFSFKSLHLFDKVSMYFKIWTSYKKAHKQVVGKIIFKYWWNTILIFIFASYQVQTLSHNYIGYKYLCF